MSVAIGVVAIVVGSICLGVVVRRWADRRRLDSYGYIDRNVAIANVGLAVALIVVGVRFVIG